MAHKRNSGDDQERLLSDGGEPPPRALTRRSYIELGATTVVSLTATVAGTGSLRRQGIEFDRTLDAVADLGMDPTGTEPVDGRIQAAGDGTLLRFPAGNYRLDPDGITLNGGTRGFEAIDETVSFVAHDTGRPTLFDAVGMEAVYLDGIAFDQPGTQAAVIHLQGDRLAVRNVEHLSARSHNAGSDSAGTDSLVIRGPKTTYECTVDGQIAAEGGAGAYPPSGTNAEGTVSSGQDRYTVDGEITDLSLDGEGSAYLNDHAVNPEDFDSGYPHELGFGPESRAATVSVTDRSPWGQPVVDGPITVPTSVTPDRIRFDGTVESLSAVGAVTISFNAQG